MAKALGWVLQREAGSQFVACLDLFAAGNHARGCEGDTTGPPLARAAACPYISDSAGAQSVCTGNRNQSGTTDLAGATAIPRRDTQS